MLEQFEAVSGKFRSAWRFRWHAVATAWILAILAWTVVFAIPSQYQSSARVFVDTNTLLRPLLEGIAVPSNSGSQVDLIRRALLGRPQLERVIAETDLQRRVQNAREREDLVGDLMKQITITADASSPQSREANIFSIAYADPDRHLAFSVVSTLLASFVEQSVGANRSDSDAAQRFLKEQITDYERRLTAAETQLADFKKKNIGSMPDERGGYFERLQTEMTALDQLQANLNVATHKRDDLRAKLLGGGGPKDASPTESSGLETSVDGRLKEATARLEELLLRFTDQHPDVVAARETIARLQEQRTEELDSMRRNTGALGAPRASTSLVAQNLQIALNQAEVDVAALDAQAHDRQRRVADLRQQINTLPGVEAELLRLNRDYNVTKTEYERLLQRLESAKLSDAADRVDEVRFKVIDPPVEAIIPIKPKRVLLLLGALVFALGASGSLAWFLSQLKPVFVKPRELEKFPGIPVLGTVSHVSSLRENHMRRLRLALLAGAIALIFVADVALIALHTPLEAMARQILAKKGTT